MQSIRDVPSTPRRAGACPPRRKRRRTLLVPPTRPSACRVDVRGDDGRRQRRAPCRRECRHCRLGREGRRPAPGGAAPSMRRVRTRARVEPRRGRGRAVSTRAATTGAEGARRRHSRRGTTPLSGVGDVDDPAGLDVGCVDAPQGGGLSPASERARVSMPCVPCRRVRRRRRRPSPRCGKGAEGARRIRVIESAASGDEGWPDGPLIRATREGTVLRPHGGAERSSKLGDEDARRVERRGAELSAPFRSGGGDVV